MSNQDTEVLTRPAPSAPPLDWALYYASLGWPVFPCWPNAKSPMTARGLDDATTNPEDIRKWWSRQPQANVAVATGHAFDVLDVDEEGEESLLAHEPIQVASEVGCPGGGSHIHFNPSPVPLKNAVRFDKGLDIRTDRGYVLVPPSYVVVEPQPDSDSELKRKGYEGPYTWKQLPNGHLPDFPDWIVAKARRDDRGSTEETRTKLFEALNGNLADGQKHHEIVRSIFLLRKFGCDIDMLRGVVSKTISLIPDGRLGSPRAIVLKKYLDEVDKCFQKHAPDEKAWTNRSFEAYISGQASDQAEIIDPETGEILEPGAKKRTFELFTLSDLAALPDIDWAVTNFLPKGGLGMVYGSPGSGKTFFVVDLAFTLAKAPFLFAKEFPVPAPLKVVYAAGEKMQGLKKRFAAAQQHHGLTDEQADFIRVCKGVPQLFDQSLDQNVQVFIAELSESYPDGFDVLIVDTLHSAAVGAEENSATDAGREIYMARKIQDHFGCALILIHHSKKSGDDVRGSSAWKGALDTLLKVEKRGDCDHVLSCEKMGDAADSFNIEFGLRYLGDSDSLCVEWKGRVQVETKNASEECLRIGREMESRWMEASDWYELCMLETVRNSKALGQTLTRLAAKGADKTGFREALKNPDAEWNPKKNPKVFSYDSSRIATYVDPYDRDDPYEDD